MSLMPSIKIKCDTFGLDTTSSSSRLTPAGPAASDVSRRLEPMPMLITQTGEPSGSAGRRLDSTSGHAPLASLADVAPSVMESPNATITLVFVGAMTWMYDTKKYIVVRQPRRADGSVASTQ